MRIVAAVLTHNAERHGRTEMLRRTVRSLAEADAVIVVDNGSTDGTEELVARIGGTVYRAPDNVYTCGRGMNVTITAAAKLGDIVVFSNDDICWKPGWREELAEWWAGAPADVAITSGLLEDEYPWNTSLNTIDVGRVRGLVRATVPGGAWTLRSADWPSIGPVPERVGWDDVPTCRRLVGEGRRVIALDLADHLGVEHSTWGNGSAAFGEPLDRRAWGLPNLRLPAGYRSQVPQHFDDHTTDTGIVWQPDVYVEAELLAEQTGASTIVDLGCGAARKLIPLADRFDVVGVDVAQTVDWLPQVDGCRWVRFDLDGPGELPDDVVVPGAVVVCADVIEHLRRPERLGHHLRRLVAAGCTIVLSTPDRVRTWGPAHLGPPPNPTHAREWAADELVALLGDWGLRVRSQTWTRSSDQDDSRDTILVVIGD